MNGFLQQQIFLETNSKNRYTYTPIQLSLFCLVAAASAAAAAAAVAAAVAAAAEGLVSVQVSVNGAFFRSPTTNKQRGRPAFKELQIHPSTTVGHINKHFTEVLAKRSTKP